MASQHPGRSRRSSGDSRSLAFRPEVLTLGAGWSLGRLTSTGVSFRSPEATVAVLGGESETLAPAAWTYHQITKTIFSVRGGSHANHTAGPRRGGMRLAAAEGGEHSDREELPLRRGGPGRAGLWSPLTTEPGPDGGLQAGAVAAGCEKFCRAKWRRPLTRKDMIERWATGPSSDVSMSW